MLTLSDLNCSFFWKNKIQIISRKSVLKQVQVFDSPLNKPQLFSSCWIITSITQTDIQSLCISCYSSFDHYSWDLASLRALVHRAAVCFQLTHFENSPMSTFCFVAQLNSRPHFIPLLYRSSSPAWLVVTLTDTLGDAPAPLTWETPLRAWTIKV